MSFYLFIIDGLVNGTVDADEVGVVAVEPPQLLTVILSDCQPEPNGPDAAAAVWMLLLLLLAAAVASEDLEDPIGATFLGTLKRPHSVA